MRHLRDVRSRASFRRMSIFAAVAALVAQTLLMPASAAFAAPVINEVMPKPTVEVGTSGEWIEIHNPGNEDEDVSGWIVNDGVNNFTFPENTVIATDGYFVICKNIAVEGVVCNAEWAAMSLLDVGDIIALKDSDMSDVDTVSYGPTDVEQEASIEVVRQDNTQNLEANATDEYDSSGNHGTPGAANKSAPTGQVKNERTGEYFTTIQGAIDDSDSIEGDTIVVLGGSHSSNVTIDYPLNLIGESDATIVGQVSIFSSDVVLAGLTITNPTYNGATIKGVHVYGNNAGISGVVVVDNVFTNIHNENTKGAYGVMVQGNVSDVLVLGNIVSNISSNGWTRGIEVTPASGVAGLPANIEVIANVVEAVTNASGDDQYDFTVDLSGTTSANALEVYLRANSFSGAVYNKDTVNTLDASENWWGQETGPSINQAQGNVVTEPWCDSEDCETLSNSDGDIILPVYDGEAVSPDEDLVIESEYGAFIIPANTTITADSTEWDGTILPPTLSNYEVSGNFTTTLALTVGSDLYDLQFDKPVELELTGQAGKLVGFVKVGSETFNAIQQVCDESNQIPAGFNECTFEIGEDLFIVTNHFTTFVAYEQQSANGNGGTSTNNLGVEPLDEIGDDETLAVRTVSYNNPQTTYNVTGDSQDGDVLGSSDNVGAIAESGPAPVVEPSEEGWKLWGMAWYWWVVIIGTLGAAGWAGMNWYRNRGQA